MHPSSLACEQCQGNYTLKELVECNINWLNETGTATWYKVTSVLHSSKVVWIVLDICALYISKLRYTGPSQDDFQQCLTQISITSSSNHAFAWSCTMTLLLYASTLFHSNSFFFFRRISGFTLSSHHLLNSVSCTVH